MSTLHGFGLEMKPLPDGYTPLNVIAVIECLNEEGEHTFVTRDTGVDALRRLGALRLSTILAEQSVLDAFVDDPEDEG